MPRESSIVVVHIRYENMSRRGRSGQAHSLVVAPIRTGFSCHIACWKCWKSGLLPGRLEEMQSTHCRRAILVISMVGYSTHPRCAGENRKLVYAGYLWICEAPGEYMRLVKVWLPTGGAILILSSPLTFSVPTMAAEIPFHLSERPRSQAETVGRKGSQAGETNETLTEAPEPAFGVIERGRRSEEEAGVFRPMPSARDQMAEKLCKVTVDQGRLAIPRGEKKFTIFSISNRLCLHKMHRGGKFITVLIALHMLHTRM